MPPLHRMAGRTSPAWPPDLSSLRLLRPPANQLSQPVTPKTGSRLLAPGSSGWRKKRWPDGPMPGWKSHPPTRWLHPSGNPGLHAAHGGGGDRYRYRHPSSGQGPPFPGTDGRWHCGRGPWASAAGICALRSARTSCSPRLRAGQAGPIRRGGR